MLDKVAKDGAALLADLKEVLPEIAQKAARTEDQRQLLPENIKLLKDVGLHKAFLPKAYGGYELPWTEYVESIVALGGACPSTAWTFSLCAQHSQALGMYSKELQDEVWGDNPDALAASSIAPFGKVTEVEGGVRLSGTMPWSSGCDFAEWNFLGFNRENADGAQDHCLGLVPASDYTIRDEWYASGMRGSGSNTVVIDDVFVPDYRIETLMTLMTGTTQGAGLYPDSPIYRAQFMPYFGGGFCAVALGMAERALELFKERQEKRVRAYTGTHLKAATPALMRLAESTHQVAAARAFLEKYWRELADFSARGEFPDELRNAQWRTNQGYAVKMCVESVDRIFAGAGAVAWLDSSELQRIFRDIHTTASHAVPDYDSCAQIFGRALMGLEPDPTLK